MINIDFNSTGGIIALGLGVQHWPLEKCIEKFVTLAEKAFQPQKGINTWGLSYLATLIHKGKYRTRPFEKALQEEFGEKKPLFGGENSVNQFKIKVAVTSTTNVESEPVVLTNYNRPEPSNRKLRRVLNNMLHKLTISFQLNIALKDLIIPRKDYAYGRRK